ncbi:MAG: hypothetical protein K0S53_1266 [Bacteroidetes bacterium]|jgi:hypothetical protein|nr:hypothetical protein [Bacteroidota bacterium]
MKFCLYLLLIILTWNSSLFSQTKKRNFRQHEVGIFLGGAYYIGDLNPRKQFNLTQPAAGLFYRFTPNYRYAFRAGFNWGNVMGDDSQSEDADQLQRNLNFKSQIMEFNVLAEFNFLEYRISNDKYKFTTFLFLGLDVFTFKPRAQMGSHWIDLQPLKTEGQTNGYRLTQMAIPFGVGAKINVSKKVGIGLEWGPRKTFTDYLDDVSGTYPDPDITPFTTINGPKLSDRSKNAGSNVNEQRGNPRTKDWYFFFGLTLNFKLTFVAPPCYAYDH